MKLYPEREKAVWKFDEMVRLVEPAIKYPLDTRYDIQRGPLCSMMLGGDEAWAAPRVAYESRVQIVSG